MCIKGMPLKKYIYISSLRSQIDAIKTTNQVQNCTKRREHIGTFLPMGVHTKEKRALKFAQGA
jgi:hypothetical protein